MQQIGALLAIGYGVAVFLCGAGVVNAAESGGGGGGMLAELRARGLDVGGGLSVHLDLVEAPPNASILERHALRVDYNGAGVRLRVDGADDAYKVGLYYGEGRGSKNKEISEMIVPALLGYKTAALVIMSIFGVGIIVFKAIMIAKVAAVVAATFWLKKLFGGSHTGGGGAGQYEMHESSQLHPVYAEYPGDISELGYAQTSAGNYIAYAAPQQDITGELPEHGQELGGIGAASAQQYAYAEAPNAGTAGAAATAGAAVGLATNATAARRRSSMLSRPQAVHTYITVKRKSARH